MGFQKLNALNLTDLTRKNPIWTQYRTQREESIQSIEEETKQSIANLSDEDVENVDPQNDAITETVEEKTHELEIIKTPQKQQ